MEGWRKVKNYGGRFIKVHKLRLPLLDDLSLKER